MPTISFCYRRGPESGLLANWQTPTFSMLVESFLFLSDFYSVLQEVGRGEGKQTTLTGVCRANLAVGETLTVFNLAGGAATKYLLSKEEENSIHDSCNRHAFAHACNRSEEEECYF